MQHLMCMLLFSDVALMPVKYTTAPCKGNYSFCFTMLLPKRKQNCTVSADGAYFYSYTTSCRKKVTGKQKLCATESVSSGKRKIECRGDLDVCNDVELTECDFDVKITHLNKLTARISHSDIYRVPSSYTGNQ